MEGGAGSVECGGEGPVERGIVGERPLEWVMIGSSWGRPRLSSPVARQYAAQVPSSTTRSASRAPAAHLSCALTSAPPSVIRMSARSNTGLWAVAAGAGAEWG